jgi:site-specific DNA recombinase
MPLMRCVIYTRVSTAEQGREGASLPVQLQACRKHAAEQGWAVVDELQDIQSGLDVDRAADQQVIALARAHAIDFVLVGRLDRFGRDEAEAMLRLKEMAKLQTKVVSATEGEQSPFLQRLMFLLAGEESRRTSERVRPAMRKRVEEGLWVAKSPHSAIRLTLPTLDASRLTPRPRRWSANSLAAIWAAVRRVR